MKNTYEICFSVSGCAWPKIILQRSYASAVASLSAGRRWSQGSTSLPLILTSTVRSLPPPPRSWTSMPRCPIDDHDSMSGLTTTTRRPQHSVTPSGSSVLAASQWQSTSSSSSSSVTTSNSSRAQSSVMTQIGKLFFRPATNSYLPFGDSVNKTENQRRQSGKRSFLLQRSSGAIVSAMSFLLKQLQENARGFSIGLSAPSCPCSRFCPWWRPCLRLSFGLQRSSVLVMSFSLMHLFNRACVLTASRLQSSGSSAVCLSVLPWAHHITCILY